MESKNWLKAITVSAGFILSLIGCTSSSDITESSSLSSSAPTNLTVGTVTASAVTISWTDNSSAETGYEVEMCSGSGCSSYTAVSASPLAANSTSHTQTGLTASTIYKFRVRATNSFGPSDYVVSSEATTSSGVSANSCTSPTTTVVDYGQRATAGTVLGVRGAYSSIALHPTTGYPAVVYNETFTVGAANLKFRYWNGSEFKTETVVGGVTTTYVKLVYLSSGIPLIFWGNGATALYGAARSTASTSTEGTWTVVALDTSSTAIRGVDAAVNPNDEVAIQFVTNTNVASAMKAIICESSCATMSTTNYPAATVMDTVNSSTNSYSVGTAWCYSGTQYYPVMFYGSSANFRLATCRQSTLANCSGNWNAGIIGAANANRLATSIYIDPTAADGTVYMAGLGAAGIIPYTMSNCATNAAAATWGSVTTGTAFGAATTGNAWFGMGRDSSGNFHVVANDAATIIRYFNVSTANFVAGVWSAAPATNYVETTGAAGLQAGGAGRGAMVVDSTNDQVLTSYGRTAAVTPISTWGNVVLAYNDCPNGVGGCTTTTLGSAAASTGMWWGNMPLDESGQIQKTSAAMPNVSTAATSSGRPAIAYVDYSVGGTADPIIGARLKYAYRDGTSASSVWTINVIGTTSAPQSPSLAFDENDLPWISWNETPTATVSQKFFLATNTRTDGQGAWTIYSFPAYYLVGAVTALPVMSQSTLAMYKSGSTKKPLMAIMTSTATAAGREVRAALFDPATRSWGNVKQVATFAGTATIGGANLTSDSDDSGNVVIAWNDLSTGAGQVNCSSTARCIRMAYTTDGGATWATTSTSGVINGAYEAARIKLNPSNSRPAISFFDRTNNMIRYKYCSTALASCTSSSNWADVGVGILDASLGISGLAEATNFGVVDSGLSFTSDGLPWVVYPRGAGATSANLMYANVSTSGASFGSPTTLYTHPGVGIISTPVAATANNHAISWNPSSVRSSSTGSLHTAFVGPGNFLYVTSCGD